MQLVSFFNAVVWGACFYLLLGTKPLIVLAIIVTVALTDWLDLGRGRIWLWRIGFVLLVTTIFVEAGAFPRPSEWRQSMGSMLQQLPWVSGQRAQ